MAFSFTRNNQQGHLFGLKITCGTYTNSAGGDIGGDIVTGLGYITAMQLQPVTTAVVTDQHVVNETMPLSTGTATIVTGGGESGVWMAVGL